MNDVLLLKLGWLAIAGIGLLASARAVRRNKDRLHARGIHNGPRLFLARGRLLQAHIWAAAFSLWVMAGIWSLAQPPGITVLRELILGALMLGFASAAGAVVYGEIRDELLERMLTPPAGSPRRRKED